MLIVTAKLPRRRLAVSAAAVLLCCAALVVSLASPTRPVAAAVSDVPDPKGVHTNEDRIAYLNSCGWQVSPDPTAVEELLIPAQMDDSYQEYLDLQHSQGFHLEKYAGKRVKRYTYTITNYPTGEDGIVVNLLIRRHTVVGGEVLSPQLDGFLHGLTRP